MTADDGLRRLLPGRLDRACEAVWGLRAASAGLPWATLVHAPEPSSRRAVAELRREVSTALAAADAPVGDGESWLEGSMDPRAIRLRGALTDIRRMAQAVWIDGLGNWNGHAVDVEGVLAESGDPVLRATVGWRAPGGERAEPPAGPVVGWGPGIVEAVEALREALALRLADDATERRVEVGRLAIDGVLGAGPES